MTLPRSVFAMSSRLALLLLLLLTGCATPRPAGTAAAPPLLTHGTAVGEVTDSTAVVWGRCDRAATLHVRLTDSERSVAEVVDPERDFTARLALDGLQPDTSYGYRAWCGDGSDADDGARGARAGQFRTTPARDASRALRIAFSGDLGGQNVCRDAARGYPIFAIIAARRPDLFIALGDMIYGDDTCGAVGRYGNAQVAGPPPARTTSEYWAHWRYNRADAAHQALLATTPMAPVWDDHEIGNDVGPSDPRLAAARAAFLDYQPLRPPADAPTQLYRSQRWGRHLELFFLDLRQYRADNAAPDDAAAPKPLLGAAQVAWLIESMAASDATWKVLIASVPLAIPTGAATARDGVASGDSAGGFEGEIVALFRALQARGVRPPLWLTTDVHFATGFRHRPLPEHPEWVVQEVVTGPLNAGLFPQRQLDPTFQPERTFFWGPKTADAVTSFDEAVGWFNFGMLEILASGRLSIVVINGTGQTVYRTSMRPDAPPAAAR